MLRHFMTQLGLAFIAGSMLGWSVGRLGMALADLTISN